MPRLETGPCRSNPGALSDKLMHPNLLVLASFETKASQPSGACIVHNKKDAEASFLLAQAPGAWIRPGP